MNHRSYNVLKRLQTFEERYEYLRLGGRVGEETFGFDRIFNQAFYKSKAWKQARRDVIIRDGGCDLGIEDRPIFDKVIIHHMNPVTMEQLEEADPSLFDIRYLICVSHATHNAIHYGDDSLLIKTNFVERRPGDTRLW